MVQNYDRDLYKVWEVAGRPGLVHRGLPWPSSSNLNFYYQAHTQALFKGLLIHLDDPNEEIQAS